MEKLHECIHVTQCPVECLLVFKVLWFLALLLLGYILSSILPGPCFHYYILRNIFWGQGHLQEPCCCYILVQSRSSWKPGVRLVFLQDVEKLKLSWSPRSLVSPSRCKERPREGLFSCLTLRGFIGGEREQPRECSPGQQRDWGSSVCMTYKRLLRCTHGKLSCSNSSSLNESST